MSADGPQGSSYPRLSAAIDSLKEWSNLSDSVERLLETEGAKYGEYAERSLAALEPALASRNGSIEEALDGYVEMTVDTLRLQANFFRTGVFSYLDDSPGDELHQDEELMLGRYLPGLYLAAIFWPNHFAKTGFFREQYLPSLAPESQLLDVGTGPGSYGLLCAEHGHRVTFNDLSPHSKVFVNAMTPDATDFYVGSFLDIETDQSFDAVVFSEVVEHLPDPMGGMAKLRELCRPEASVFFSTATNAAFYDHTIIFATVDEIRDMIAEHRFVIEAEQEVLATAGPDGRDVIDFNAVLRPAP